MPRKRISPKQEMRARVKVIRDVVRSLPAREWKQAERNLAVIDSLGEHELARAMKRLLAVIRK